MSLEQRD
jgi:hypothetical protein